MPLSSKLVLGLVLTIQTCHGIGVIAPHTASQHPLIHATTRQVMRPSGQPCSGSCQSQWPGRHQSSGLPFEVSYLA